jgi:hypothetical protein
MRQQHAPSFNNNNGAQEPLQKNIRRRRGAVRAFRAGGNNDGRGDAKFHLYSSGRANNTRNPNKISAAVSLFCIPFIVQS